MKCKQVLCLVQSPLLRVQTPMGKCSAERDSALQLLGEVCLQPLRFGDSAPSAAPPPTDISGGLHLKVEQQVRALYATAMIDKQGMSYACCM